jgi:hypothetical protein
VIAAFFRLAPPTPQTLGSLDDATKAAIRERFDMVAYAQRAFGGEIQREGDEVRILGQGGLLINPRTGEWYNFSNQIGGDCFDLVAYVKYRTQVRNLNGKSSEILQEAASFVGMILPERQHAPAAPAVSGSHRAINTTATTRSTQTNRARVSMLCIWTSRSLCGRPGMRLSLRILTFFDAGVSSRASSVATLGRSSLSRLSVAGWRGSSRGRASSSARRRAAARRV